MRIIGSEEPSEASLAAGTNQVQCFTTIRMSGTRYSFVVCDGSTAKVGTYPPMSSRISAGQDHPIERQEQHSRQMYLVTYLNLFKSVGESGLSQSHVLNRRSQQQKLSRINASKSI